MGDGGNKLVILFIYVVTIMLFFFLDGQRDPEIPELSIQKFRDFEPLLSHNASRTEQEGRK